MYESIDSEVILRRHYAVAVQWAIAANAKAAEEFRKGKEFWLENAAILQALGKPLGVRPVPAPVQKVAIVGPEQERTVVTSWGPEYAADPTCELPAPPPENPPGVTDVGAYNFGGIWAAGPLDTRPADFVTEHQGHKLKRIGRVGPFGGQGWYQEA